MMASLLRIAPAILLVACGRFALEDTSPSPPLEASVDADAATFPQDAPVEIVAHDATINGNAWLAFDSDRDGTRCIYFMRADGTGLVRFTTSVFVEQQPTFSPDGTKLAFTSNASGAMQIHVIDLGTSVVTQITSKAYGAAQSAWSRDGKLIAFVALADPDAGETHAVGDVFVVEPDGTHEQHVVTPSSNAFAFDSAPTPTFTADSSGIVYLDYQTIRTIQLDGTSARDVAGCVTTSPETPTLSPDGSRMAYGVWWHGEGIFLASFAGYCQLPNQSCATLVVEPGASNTLDSDRRPSWSVDDVIAYERIITTVESDGSVSGAADIAIASIYGGASILLTNDSADDRNPTWAPSTFHP